MRLINYLSKEFEITSGDQVVTGAELKLLSESPPVWLEILRNKKVAIHVSVINFFNLAILLDGVVESIFVVSENACDKFIMRAEESGLVDCVLVDAKTQDSCWKVTKINFNDAYEINSSESSSTVDTRWLLATSGTTNTPKIVSHPLASLIRTASQKTTSKAWGLLYDYSRFAGMQVLLQAYVAGTRLIAPNTSDFSSAISTLVSKGCKSLSATPTLWRKILMASESDGLSLDQVTLGGEIVDQNTLNILSKRFANAKITHIYASTEAGVGFSVQDGKSGFPSEWLEIGVRNINLMLSSDSTLLIKNTTHGQFYINDSVTASLCDDDGWIDTGDIVEVTADRAYFKGRLNGSINIGGNKVFPEEVEAEILKIAGVSQVMVRGKSSSIAGQLLEALIVPSDNVTDFKVLIGAIKDACASNLPKFKRPVFFKQVNQIEISASGKLKR